MKKVFEDEFMDLQLEYISLCMELVEGKVDEVYVYITNEKHVRMFNAFFRQNGEIKTVGEICPDTEVGMEFLGIGCDDIERIRDVCKKYGMKAPTEIRMFYDVKKGSFDGHYEYEPVCSDETGLYESDVFDAWVSEMREKPFTGFPK